jgi:hypothetical protein
MSFLGVGFIYYQVFTYVQRVEVEVSQKHLALNIVLVDLALVYDPGVAVRLSRCKTKINWGDQNLATAVPSTIPQH